MLVVPVFQLLFDQTMKSTDEIFEMKLRNKELEFSSIQCHDIGILFSFDFQTEGLRLSNSFYVGSTRITFISFLPFLQYSHTTYVPILEMISMVNWLAYYHIHASQFSSCLFFHFLGFVSFMSLALRQLSAQNCLTSTSFPNDCCFK